MRIGELAKRSGVTVRTIRYYIEQGLLPPPPKRGSYGEFDEAYLPRLRLILRLKKERLSISAIRERLVRMGLATASAVEREAMEGDIFRSRFAEEAGLTPEQVSRLEQVGLLSSSEGLLPAEAIPLARAAAYLLRCGATMEDLAMLVGQIRQEMALYRRLLDRVVPSSRATDSFSRALQWQEQLGAVNAIREMLLGLWGALGREGDA